MYNDCVWQPSAIGVQSKLCTVSLYLPNYGLFTASGHYGKNCTQHYYSHSAPPTPRAKLTKSAVYNITLSGTTASPARPGRLSSCLMNPWLSPLSLSLPLPFYPSPPAFVACLLHPVPPPLFVFAPRLSIATRRSGPLSAREPKQASFHTFLPPPPRHSYLHSALLLLASYFISSAHPRSTRPTLAHLHSALVALSLTSTPSTQVPRLHHYTHSEVHVVPLHLNPTTPRCWPLLPHLPPFSPLGPCSHTTLATAN